MRPTIGEPCRSGSSREVVCVFSPDGDDEYSDPRSDDGSWVFLSPSDRPHGVGAPYQRFGSRWIGGAATGAPALHSAASRQAAVSARGRLWEAEGARRRPWILR